MCKEGRMTNVVRPSAFRDNRLYRGGQPPSPPRDRRAPARHFFDFVFLRAFAPLRENLLACPAQPAARTQITGQNGSKP